MISGFPGGSAGKESACNTGGLGVTPGLEIYTGEGNGYPFQNSGLENFVVCIVHGFTKGWTCLSNFLIILYNISSHQRIQFA